MVCEHEYMNTLCVPPPSIKFALPLPPPYFHPFPLEIARSLCEKFIIIVNAMSKYVLRVLCMTKFVHSHILYVRLKRVSFCLRNAKECSMTYRQRKTYKKSSR